MTLSSFGLCLGNCHLDSTLGRTHSLRSRCTLKSAWSGALSIKRLLIGEFVKFMENLAVCHI